jgi:HEAT repeat protein
MGFTSVLMFDRNMLESWIADLDSADPEVHQGAVEKLLDAGSAAVEALIRTMQTQTGRKAWEAASILSQIDDPRWREPMKAMLTSPNPIVAALAAAALERFGASVIDAFVDALPRCSCVVQMQIVGILGRIGDQRCVFPLINLLCTTQSGDIQHITIHALGRLGDRRAIVSIRTFQNHKNHLVRERARAALKRLEAQANHLE